MLVELDKESGEVGDVDDPDHVGFAGCDAEGGRRIVIDDC